MSRTGGALAAAAAPDTSRARAGWRDGIAYGGLGLPLAFLALPLYVVLPSHYATEFGVPLAMLGAVLLGVRLFDAVIDPWIGRRVDALFSRSSEAAWRAVAVAGVVLAIAFRGLFFPPTAVTAAGTAAVLAWGAALLAVTYAAYSVATVSHQAWGARLGGDAVRRARIVAWREGLSLAGVLVASVLPTAVGLGAATVTFAVSLAAGVALLKVAVAPEAVRRPARDAAGPRPLASADFRRLLAIYLVNGIASAIPATLVLFFVRDRLDARAFEPLFLGGYFAFGALSVPAWVAAVRRYGLARCWLAGMFVSIAAFGWAGTLGPGDVVPFAIVCAASGLALGADLTLPPALLAGVIQRAGDGKRGEGAYFGWWNFATKLNLALAAGVSLPALQWLGYSPGSRSADGLHALVIAYCALPCLLKLGACALLYVLWIRPRKEDT